MEARKSKLRDEITKLEKLEEQLKNLKTLESFTVAEKTTYFDKVYELAKKIVEEKLSSDYCEDNNNKEWAFELVMEIFGKKIWELYNGSD